MHTAHSRVITDLQIGGAKDHMHDVAQMLVCCACVLTKPLRSEAGVGVGAAGTALVSDIPVVPNEGRDER